MFDISNYLHIGREADPYFGANSFFAVRVYKKGRSTFGTLLFEKEDTGVSVLPFGIRESKFILSPLRL